MQGGRLFPGDRAGVMTNERPKALTPVTLVKKQRATVARAATPLPASNRLLDHQGPFL